MMMVVKILLLPLAFVLMMQNAIAEFDWRVALAAVQPSGPTERAPYYHLVPKDRDENLAFRDRMIALGSESKENANDIWIMCSRDLLFWVNTFCYILEPREPAIHPFITYPFQDESFYEIDDAIGHHDLVIEKSRDMGASWMIVSACKWHHQFHELHTYLWFSQKQDLVDKRGDPKSLFTKFDFLNEHQPGWLLYPEERRLMHSRNLDRGSVIDGDSTTATPGIGDRRVAIFFDEFSKCENGYEMLTSSRDVTYSRIWNFTPFGTGNAAEEIAHDARFRKITLHWTRHPDKAAGLYHVSEAGDVTVLDQAWHKSHPGYAFIIEPPDAGQPKWQGLRSPLFDKETSRIIDPRELAQEWNLNYTGSDSQFFSGKLLNRLREDVRHPYELLLLSDILETPETLEWKDFWRRIDEAKIRLWTHLSGGKPADDRRYTVGVDVSGGTGASNSVIGVEDCQTGEIVAEFAHAEVLPNELAHIAKAVGTFFGGNQSQAEIAWEDRGVGQTFRKVLTVLGYTNMYYPRSDSGLRKRAKKPGFEPTPENKGLLLRGFRQALASRTCIVRSKEMIEEARRFIFVTDQKIEHAASAKTKDPTKAGSNHGDRVIAHALACWVAGDIDIAKVEEVRHDPSCIAMRREADQRAQRDKSRQYAGRWSHARS